MKRLALIALVVVGCAAATPSGTPHLAFLTPDPTEDVPVEPATEPTANPLPPKPAPNAYKALSARNWQLLAKAPDKYTGKYYVVWACITQFDAATGTDSFRGDASFKKLAYWSLGDNAFFGGTDAQLEPFVADDIVLMNVTVVGSYSYDTQNGGNTTVPLFRVDKIARKGSCA